RRGLYDVQSVVAGVQVRGGDTERPAHAGADGVVTVRRVDHVVLHLSQSVANGDVQRGSALLIRVQVRVLTEQGHRRAADDQEHGHGDHQFEQREAGLLARFHGVWLRVHGCTKLDWKVTGGFKLWLVSATTMVI